jgi:alkylhydroperoxidase family enzyme
MNALQEVEWLKPLADRARNPELEQYVRNETGLLTPYTRFFASCPWIMRADIDLDISCAHIGGLASLIYLTVSRENSCRFCYGASRMLMRMAGMSRKQVERLEEDVETARLEPRVNLALDFARRISRSNPAPTDADRKALRDVGFSEAAIDEMVLFTGVVVFHNRFATLLALPVRSTERLAESRFAGLIKSRFQQILGRLNTLNGGAAQSQPLDHGGPFGELTRRLEDLPHARVLRGMIDEAWQSPNLPVRSKALVFAVIARGLGCATAEREARRLLEQEGFGESALEETLANLASPALDARESHILPYVRETIWYQPAPVQRRGKALQAEIGNAPFVETVGVAALANMVCRVALALEAH